MDSKTTLTGRELEALRGAFAALRGLASRGQKAAARQTFRAHARSLLPAQCDQADLTEREVDVLAHVATGLKNGEIAVALGLAPETVKSYLSSARLKLGAVNRHEAVALSRQAGVLP